MFGESVVVCCDSDQMLKIARIFRYSFSRNLIGLESYETSVTDLTIFKGLGNKFSFNSRPNIRQLLKMKLFK